jgi:hypothetical protein
MRSNSPKHLLRVLFAWLALCAGSPVQASDPEPTPRSATYPLDDIARVLDPGEALPCLKRTPELVDYRGVRLRYQKPARIHPAFRVPLSSFEAIAAEIALKHYGRVPRAVVHLGTYNCRVMRRYPEWVSEHALGNAIDIAGFDFGPLPRNAARTDMPAALRRGFQVRVDRHWSGAGTSAVHAAFLHDLAEALAARPDVFRVVLGPGFPGHHNHLHLDHAPYRVVDFKT